jgi:hypothetical protein
MGRNSFQFTATLIWWRGRQDTYMHEYQSTKSSMNKVKFIQIYVFFHSELILNSLLWLS